MLERKIGALNVRKQGAPQEIDSIQILLRWPARHAGRFEEIFQTVMDLIGQAPPQLLWEILDYLVSNGIGDLRIHLSATGAGPLPGASIETRPDGRYDQYTIHIDAGLLESEEDPLAFIHALSLGFTKLYMHSRGLDPTRATLEEIRPWKEKLGFP